MSRQQYFNVVSKCHIPSLTWRIAKKSLIQINHLKNSLFMGFQANNKEYSIILGIFLYSVSATTNKISIVISWKDIQLYKLYPTSKVHILTSNRHWCSIIYIICSEKILYVFRRNHYLSVYSVFFIYRGFINNFTYLTATTDLFYTNNNNRIQFIVC